jgi:hypothetical protein
MLEIADHLCASKLSLAGDVRPRLENSTRGYRAFVLRDDGL